MGVGHGRLDEMTECLKNLLDAGHEMFDQPPREAENLVLPNLVGDDDENSVLDRGVAELELFCGHYAGIEGRVIIER